MEGLLQDSVNLVCLLRFDRCHPRLNTGINPGGHLALDPATGTFLHVNNSTASYASIAHFTNGTTGAGAANGLITGVWADNNTYLFNYYSSALIFGTAAAERMRIESGGNVAIGTTSAGGYKLNVNGTINATGLYVNGTAVSSGTSYASCGAYRDMSVWAGGGCDSAPIYQCRNGSTVEIFRVAAPGCSCFLAGTKVLMADGTWKAIELVEAGEFVVGVNGVNEVLDTWRTKLGPHRSVWRFGDQLAFSGEHLFWVRRDDGTETFGTHDYTQYLYEKKHSVYTIKGVPQNYVGMTRTDALAITDPMEFAHISGWVKDRAKMDRSYGDETPLFNLIVGGSHTFIANGFVVGGEVRDDDYDFANVSWRGPLFTPAPVTMPKAPLRLVG